MNNDLLDKINKLYQKTKADKMESKTLYQGNFIKLIEEDFILPNGIIMKRERIVKNNDKESVIIITITSDNKFLLVFQNRINGVTLEFPSGYVEEGESILDAAIRELEEETGYTSSDIKILDSYYANPSIDNSTVNIVLIKDAIKTTKQNLGKYEYINYNEFTLDELKELVNLNYISGVGNKLAFYELLELLNKDKDKILVR